MAFTHEASEMLSFSRFDNSIDQAFGVLHSIRLAVYLGFECVVSLCSFDRNSCQTETKPIGKSCLAPSRPSCNTVQLRITESECLGKPYRRSSRPGVRAESHHSLAVPTTSENIGKPYRTSSRPGCVLSRIMAWRYTAAGEIVRRYRMYSPPNATMAIDRLCMQQRTIV